MNLNKFQTDFTSGSKFYPNKALIVSEDTKFEDALIDHMKKLRQSNLLNKHSMEINGNKHNEIFDFRVLSRTQVQQFSQSKEYIDPIIRAGQVVVLPSFKQPQAYFWEIYRHDDVKFNGGLQSQFQDLNKKLVGEQMKDFHNFNSQVDNRVEFDDDLLIKFILEVSLRKVDFGESDLVSTVWKYN